ncbi:phophatidylserine decarboxylase associated domain-containing protein [Arhodomonas sp. AD133]|uniref:phophatidylserine decarboxylase associated domain-containing protein n=1 Tax=Arhodomonas sp. AD133 TaxID=3415009 RepID=UPI003EB832CF
MSQDSSSSRTQDQTLAAGGDASQHNETDGATLSNNFEQQFRQSFGVLAGYLPKEGQQLGFWLSELARRSQEVRAADPAMEYQPSVAAMEAMLAAHPELYQQVQEMVAQGLKVHEQYEPDMKYGIRTVEDMLDALNYIIQRAPAYDPDKPHYAFPVSGLFVYMMYTPAGTEVFTNTLFNDMLRDVLDAWCAYLDSPASLDVITTAPDGWLSPASYAHNNLDQFVTQADREKDPVHWGFTSFNDFFHRQIIPICRPLDGPDNPRVVVSANDGTVYRIARQVKREDDICTKSQNYSLVDMLDDSPYVDEFVGGDVLQSFLSGNDYHRWTAPIAGEVIEARVIPGFMFSELLSEGFDPSAGTQSQGYQANVNTRGLVIIRSPDPALGLVCVIPIGITEISSVDIQVDVGQQIEKGQELGWFSYGGSSMCLVFQPGAIAQFTVPNPLPHNDSDNGPFIRARAQIAIAAQNATKDSKQSGAT